MVELTNDVETLAKWVGHSQSVTDVLADRPAQFMEQTLDREGALTNSDRSALWHFIYFTESAG